MTRPPNDPLVNPQVWDVVRRKETRQASNFYCITVQARCGNLVAFTAEHWGDSVWWRTLDAWIDLCRDAEVLHVAK